MPITADGFLRRMASSDNPASDNVRRLPNDALTCLFWADVVSTISVASDWSV